MSSTFLKLSAAFLMLIDHVGLFFPNTPIFLRQLGRISAPIFLYTAAIGFHHTKNRLKYLKNLYFFSVFMSFMACFLNYFMQNPPKSYIHNNIFSTILVIDIFIYIIQNNKLSLEKRNLYLFYFIVYNIAAYIFSSYFLIGHKEHIAVLVGIIPNVFFCEGGTFIVTYGVLTYIFMDKKKHLIILNILTSLFILLSQDLSLYTIFNVNIQWMMVFSLPFILLYNGQKGKGYKQFFYIFYPAHIAILFIFSYLVLK